MGAAPASASTPTTTRTGPDPSSTVRPSPSASADGASVIVPVTLTRHPSIDSPAAPVLISIGNGTAAASRSWTSARLVRTVRWP